MDVVHNNCKHGCALCEKEYTTKTDLTRHVKHAHGGAGKKGFVCEHCGLECTKASVNNGHVQHWQLVQCHLWQLVPALSNVQQSY